jgi:Mn2+/Fe2+ NRAMP family transporter
VLLFLEQFGARRLEMVFAMLVATMTLSMGWMYVKAECPTDEVISGALIPQLKCVPWSSCLHDL